MRKEPALITCVVANESKIALEMEMEGDDDGDPDRGVDG